MSVSNAAFLAANGYDPRYDNPTTEQLQRRAERVATVEQSTTSWTWQHMKPVSFPHAPDPHFVDATRNGVDRAVPIMALCDHCKGWLRVIKIEVAPL